MAWLQLGVTPFFGQKFIQSYAELYWLTSMDLEWWMQWLSG